MLLEKYFSRGQMIELMYISKSGEKINKKKESLEAWYLVIPSFFIIY